MPTTTPTTYSAQACRKLAREIANRIRADIIGDVNLGRAYVSSYGGGEGTGYPKWAAERVNLEVRVVVDGGRGRTFKHTEGLPEELER